MDFNYLAWFKAGQGAFLYIHFIAEYPTMPGTQTPFSALLAYCPGRQPVDVYASVVAEKFFGEVEEVRRLRNPYGISHTIHICRKPRAPLKKMWPEVKIFS